MVPIIGHAAGVGSTGRRRSGDGRGRLKRKMAQFMWSDSEDSADEAGLPWTTKLLIEEDIRCARCVQCTY
jgi:hypothetical protein